MARRRRTSYSPEEIAARAKVRALLAREVVLCTRCGSSDVRFYDLNNSHAGAGPFDQWRLLCKTCKKTFVYEGRTYKKQPKPASNSANANANAKKRRRGRNKEGEGKRCRLELQPDCKLEREGGEQVMAIDGLGLGLCDMEELDLSLDGEVLNKGSPGHSSSNLDFKWLEEFLMSD